VRPWGLTGGGFQAVNCRYLLCLKGEPHRLSSPGLRVKTHRKFLQGKSTVLFVVNRPFLKLQLLPVWLAWTFIREEASYLSLVFLRDFWDQSLLPTIGGVKKGPGGMNLAAALCFLLVYSFLSLFIFQRSIPFHNEGHMNTEYVRFPPQSNLTKPDKSRSQRAGDGTGGGHA